MKSDAIKTYIADLGRKYIWWDPIGDKPHSDDRILAQAMDLGTFDDIIAMEQNLGKRRLVEVMSSFRVRNSNCHSSWSTRAS